MFLQAMWLCSWHSFIHFSWPSFPPSVSHHLLPCPIIYSIFMTQGKDKPKQVKPTKAAQDTTIRQDKDHSSSHKLWHTHHRFWSTFQKRKPCEPKLNPHPNPNSNPKPNPNPNRYPNPSRRESYTEWLRYIGRYEQNEEGVIFRIGVTSEDIQIKKKEGHLELALPAHWKWVVQIYWLII